MQRRLLLAFAVIAAAPLAAQNLFNPTAWRPGPSNPGLVQGLQSTNSKLQFSPHCNAAACAGKNTGIFQDVVVPRSGWYQMTLAGYCGGTGSFSYELVADNKLLWRHAQEGGMMFNDKVWLNRGTRRVELRTSTSGVRDDKWLLRPPELVPAILPVVEVRASFEGASDLEFRMTANAVLLGISLGSLPTPIRFPGLKHGLELNPATLIIVPPNTDFLAEFQKRGLWFWPKVHVQAVTLQGFGGATQLKSW